MMKKSSKAWPENPMNGLEDQPAILLIELVSLGQLDAVKKMLLDGYDANETTEYGETAAFLAASRNDFDMLKLLAEYGAKLDVKDGRGRNIIGWAKYFKNQEMIDYINSVEREQESKNNLIMAPQQTG